MAAGYIRNISEMVNSHQYDFVVVIGGSYFQMIILDQLIETHTLDIFQVKTNVTRIVTTYLLARGALTHVLTNAMESKSGIGLKCNVVVLPSLRDSLISTHTHVYEVALGGSVHETGIRWDVHTFPLVGHTQNL